MPLYLYEPSRREEIGPVPFLLYLSGPVWSQVGFAQLPGVLAADITLQSRHLVPRNCPGSAEL